MTATRLHEILDILRWSRRDLAKALDIHPTTAARYANGRQPIPANVASWLERLAAAHEANPMPRGRRADDGA